MRKFILLGFLLAFATTAIAAYNRYPNPERFMYYNIKDTPMYLVIDTQTGCEYITNLQSESSYTYLKGTCKDPKHDQETN